MEAKYPATKKPATSFRISFLTRVSCPPNKEQSRRHLLIERQRVHLAFCSLNETIKINRVEALRFLHRKTDRALGGVKQRVRNAANVVPTAWIIFSQSCSNTSLGIPTY